MLAHLAVALTLASQTYVAPTSRPPDFAELDRVEQLTADSGVEFRAYDRRGTVIGVVVMAVEPDGTVRMFADFDDGFGDVTVDSAGTASRTSSLPAPVLERRINAIGQMAKEVELMPQDGWGKCAALTLLAIGACYSVTWVWTCGPGAFIAACECLPLIVPDNIPRDEC
jgi:hypothetical protein